MRKPSILLLLLLGAYLSTQAHVYLSSSALRSGTIIKLQVPQTGIYRLTYERIQELGLQPSQVRLLGYGGQLIDQNFTHTHLDDVPTIPFYMYKGADGVFSAGDYILFYAQGPIGWEWGGAYFKRTRNCYADYGCYFLSDSAGEQKLLQEQSSVEGNTVYDVYSYTALQLHELEQRNLLDVEHGQAGGGREFYGEVMTPQSAALKLSFDWNDIDTSQSMTCRVDAAASSSEVSYLTFKIEGTSKKETYAGIDQTDNYTYAKTKTTLITNISPTRSTTPIEMSYQCSSSNAKWYLNYVEMQMPCLMKMKGNYLVIRNTEHIGETSPSRYHLLGANAHTQIWNMTHPESASIVPVEWKQDTLCWVGSNQEPQLFIAVQTDAQSGWSSPASRGKIANQNLHAELQGVQHVIVTPEAFKDQALRLKQAHEAQRPSEKWAVVTDEQVYNEFSSGTPDASAIRWMMKYLYDNYKGTQQAPQSVLLFGDGSFDNRHILPNSAVPVLLTYQAHNSTVETNAYATDDYFGWMEDNSGVYGTNWDDRRARMQISVGRLPVNTYEEAEGVVNKLVTYMLNATTGNWKQQLCFLADDGNSGMHVTTADVAAELVRQQAPEYIINKLYLDAFVQESSASGESYPLALNTYTNLLQTGVMLMDYAGHGSANNICSEMFLTRKQVENMVNANQGVWALATCSFAHFDQTDASTAEVAVLNPVGGAIAVVSSDRTVYASENEILNKYFCENLFTRASPNHYAYSIGEALRLAKNKNGDTMNKLPFVLLGDPALRLNYPEPYQIQITNMPDTIHALDLVSLEGYIANSEQENDTVDFNGTLSISVFDKIQTIATKDNDEPDQSKKVIRYYQDFPNKLFVGNASVTNGKFKVNFRMPKDIRYNIDYGRLSLIAVGEDPMGAAEALGYSETFKVGGSSPLVIDDNEGPKITLYLNTPLFKNGDEVNTTPHFYAQLYDENGINTIGSGIGHDLLMIIDNDIKQSYILNNYYASNNNSYQEGTISYMMPQMTDGAHNLSFRAWDMLNNATTQTLGFTVNQDMGPEVKKLIVYPNPVSKTGELNMYINYDRPDDLVSMTISFYSLTGQRIWTTTQTLLGADAESLVTLDMAQTHLPAGTYIYQFRILTTTQSSQTYTGRIIVY